MSKKHKANRKQPPSAKKAVATPPQAVNSKNGAQPGASRPIQTAVSAPMPKAEPVAVPREREAAMPFWARMPFAMMDFWLSQGTRSERKS